MVGRRAGWLVGWLVWHARTHARTHARARARAQCPRSRLAPRPLTHSLTLSLTHPSSGGAGMKTLAPGVNTAEATAPGMGGLGFRFAQLLWTLHAWLKPILTPSDPDPMAKFRALASRTRHPHPLTQPSFALCLALQGRELTAASASGLETCEACRAPGVLDVWV